jgi:hypothetical protein
MSRNKTLALAATRRYYLLDWTHLVDFFLIGQILSDIMFLYMLYY